MSRVLSTRATSPWLWIPSLYVAEGLPYFAVNTLTVIMYVNMGISFSEMAFFTGWLYFPWVIKPFWSPFIDLFKTKRWWTLSMQVLIAASMASVAFFLPSSLFFTTTLVAFWLMAFFSATHDIAADGYYMIELSSHEQAAFVGIRSTFYRIASIVGQGGLVMLAGQIEQTTGNIPMSWSIVFGILSVFFLMVALYHMKVMPKSEKDRACAKMSAHSIISDFCMTFVSFFKKKYVGSALAFMLLYRLPEALCIKMIQPFLVSSRELGGLALTTTQIGLVNGTIGVVALLLGGIAGGVAISRGGLKKWLWPMALSLTLPCVFYCFLAMAQPSSFVYISAAIFIEQFGYGFGFSAYMLYLIYFSQGDCQTSHYAFCTAFMALGMMIPGMFAGWLYELIDGFSLSGVVESNGFINFFWLVMASCIVTLFVCSRLHIDAEFGKKHNNP